MLSKKELLYVVKKCAGYCISVAGMPIRKSHIQDKFTG